MGQDLLDRLEERMLAFAPSGGTGEAVRHHLRSGGSRTRARFAIEAGLALALRDEAVLAIAAGCELLHNASLIHDDLQDRDHERRGARAVWALFGSEIAVCAGDILLSAAYASLAGAPRGAELVMRAHEAVTRLVAGQGEDLAFKGRGDLGPVDYEAMARAKSGPLLSLPFELCLLAAGQDESLATARRAGEDFALGYQMIDDIADAHADAAKGEPNILAILKRAGETDPCEVARTRAEAALRAAGGLALGLPENCGASLAEAAGMLIARLDARPDAAA